MSAVEHTPLDRSTRQIRLLRFVGSDADPATICCRLDTYNLDQCPSFIALSYTWGDVHPSRKIVLNGEVFPLRQNLHSALSVLREDTLKHGTCLDHFYWIDAICINQQNDSERSHQVNMMGTIYSEARCVFVWLGPGCADSERALKKASAYWELPSTARDMFKPDFKLLEDFRQSVTESGIMASGYWERMWVIQEFTLAKDIILLQGRSRMCWEDLQLTRERVGLVDAMDRLMDGRERWMQKSFTASETTLDLLIRMFESSKCSDVRDKVYALLSLVQRLSDDPKPLYPDYTISSRQLYYRVLGNVRHSPTLRDTADWDIFRAQLREILVIPRDEQFERNDVLYRASEYERPHQKPLLNLHPEYRTRIGHALLKEVADYLHWPLAQMDWESKRIYKDIIQVFQAFPKEDDPEAWNCFDGILQEHLGLSTSEDSEMWNTFIDFPE